MTTSSLWRRTTRPNDDLPSRCTCPVAGGSPGASHTRRVPPPSCASGRLRPCARHAGSESNSCDGRLLIPARRDCRFESYSGRLPDFVYVPSSGPLSANEMVHSHDTPGDVPVGTAHAVRPGRRERDDRKTCSTSRGCSRPSDSAGGPVRSDANPDGSPAVGMRAPASR